MTKTGLRANQLGDPCPAWCTVDHAGVSVHIGERTAGDLYVYTRPLADGRPSRYQQGPAVEIGVNATAAAVDYHDAAKLADVLDALADADPLRLQQIAAGIRAAVATINGELAPLVTH